MPLLDSDDAAQVSTHSRLKAAGTAKMLQTKSLKSFNTQPPEGGWDILNVSGGLYLCFNTQPPEGGWGFSCFG